MLAIVVVGDNRNPSVEDSSEEFEVTPRTDEERGAHERQWRRKRGRVPNTVRCGSRCAWQGDSWSHRRSLGLKDDVDSRKVVDAVP